MTTTLSNAKPRRLIFYGLLVVLAIAFLVIFGWTAALPRTARIASGSMAPTLVGVHWRNTCLDCGFTWRVGQDIAPSRARFICPNCGYAENGLEKAIAQPGQRVAVRPWAYWKHPPQRGDIVAFRLPQKDAADSLVVKRIIGLPGERVAIQSGDIFIDGARWRKPWRLFHEQAVLVHDSRFSPHIRRANQAPLPLRWRPLVDDPSWRCEDGNYRYTPAADDANKTKKPLAFRWLAYHHWRCSEVPQLRTKAMPILDEYGYNLGPSRQLQVVTDVVLECEVEVAGAGELCFELRTVSPPLTCLLSAPDGQVSLVVGEAPVKTFRLPAGAFSGNQTITFGLLDHQAVLAMDGVLQCLQALPEFSPSRVRAATPFRIGVRGMSLRVGRRRIHRDIYYLDPLRLGRDWATKEPLQQAAFFVLGDNPPLSIDSRMPATGPIFRRQMIGQVCRRVQ